MNLVTATTPYSQAVKSFLENPREVYAVRFIRPDVGKERSPVLKHVYKVASVTQQVTMGALVSGVMFGGFSTLMGLFAASAMASDPTKTVTMTDSFKDMMQTLRRRARSGFRSGAMIGAAFAFTDPISDTVRTLTVLIYLSRQQLPLVLGTSHVNIQSIVRLFSHCFSLCALLCARHAVA